MPFKDVNIVNHFKNRLSVRSLALGVLLCPALALAQLTPMGSEAGANADGSIPAWTGGLTSPAPGYVKGGHYVDPYAGEKSLYSITAANLDQYKDALSPGQISLLKQYPDVKMNVYPTHRSAALPQKIYDGTAKNRTSAKLTVDDNGVENVVPGIMFPAPTTGAQAIWNHLARYRGDNVAREYANALVFPGAGTTYIRFREKILFALDTAENKMLYFRYQVTEPARLAGASILVIDPINQTTASRDAWAYSPGLRRVRRVPNLGYDWTAPTSSGLRTADQFEMFNGAPNRYDWKLIGKQELYVAYNAYGMQSPTLSFDALLTPKHINTEHARYERHRVWKVEATLKPGASHLYSRRTFYFDEDSWQALVVDVYDKDGKLWRVQEAHVINYYDVPLVFPVLETYTDLQSGAYFAFGLTNDYAKPYVFNNTEMSIGEFTSASLGRDGTR